MSAIPAAWTGVVLLPNQMTAKTMTKTRLMSEATEYVTGETMESRINARMFCPKWTMPFRMNSSVRRPWSTAEGLLERSMAPSA